MKAQSRIGIVLNNVPAYSETFFHNKINGLLKNGFTVILFAEKNGNPIPEHWKVISPFPLPLNRFLRSIYLAVVLMRMLITCPNTVFRFYKLEKATGRSSKQVFENLYINAHLLLHKLDWLHYGFATVALRRENVAAAIGAKMAISFRGYDIAVYPLKNKDCYQLLWKKVDKIHTISDDLIKRAVKIGLPIDKEIVKITPAINFDKFNIQIDIPAANNELRILTIARLHWIKGILYAFHAMKLLKDKGIAFKYTIVGDGQEMENLLFAAHQLGIRDNVVFAGKVNADNILSYLKEHRIYLQPSLQEGFCNAALEAQAAGLLTIVTDGGALKENVIHDETGWVVCRRSAEAIANAIEKVLYTGEEDKRRIINNARSRIQREFTLQKQITAFAEFYQ